MDNNSEEEYYWTEIQPVHTHPPTNIVSDKINFDSWNNLAKRADAAELPPSCPHHYFVAANQRGDSVRNFIGRDLVVFRSDSPNLFIPTPQHNKGIQCRFGMRGVIAEVHYDGGRNSIAVLCGSKR